MTPMGIVCMLGFLGSSFVLFAFTFFDPYGQVDQYYIIEKINKRNGNQGQGLAVSSIED